MQSGILYLLLKQTTDLFWCSFYKVKLPRQTFPCNQCHMFVWLLYNKWSLVPFNATGWILLECEPILTSRVSFLWNYLTNSDFLISFIFSSISFLHIFWKVTVNYITKLRNTRKSNTRARCTALEKSRNN